MTVRFSKHYIREIFLLRSIKGYSNLSDGNQFLICFVFMYFCGVEQLHPLQFSNTLLPNRTKPAIMWKQKFFIHTSLEYDVLYIMIPFTIAGQ